MVMQSDEFFSYVLLVCSVYTYDYDAEIIYR